MKEQNYISTPSMGRTACTEPQCLYKGALYLLLSVEVFLFGNACTYPGGHAPVLVYGFAWVCCVGCALFALTRCVGCFFSFNVINCHFI